jgi:hypothetical protein
VGEYCEELRVVRLWIDIGAYAGGGKGAAIGAGVG